SLYNFLSLKLDLDAVLTKLLTSNEGIAALEGVTKPMLKKVIRNVCDQIEKAYITDPTHLLEVVSAAVNKITSIEVSDYPCTKYIDTLGFGNPNKNGTLGDVISTCLASMYSGDEDTSDNKFIEDVMQKFKNGEKVDIILDTLIDVVLHDVLEKELLKTIKIDVAGLISKTDNEQIDKVIADIMSNLGDTSAHSPSLMDIINIFFTLGVVKEKSLEEVLNSYMDEYLTKSQIDTIGFTLYDFIEDFTVDSNPFKKADNNSTVSYNGKVEVVPTVKDLRLPSGVALTFGASAATTRNICWYTKTGVVGTDIEILPYSANPKFTGTPTTGEKVVAKTERVEREFPGVDLGVIQITSYKFDVNRHTIKLNSLKPGQKYSYRVGDAKRGWWSDAGVIETADNSNAFTFFHMSDSQSGTEKQYGVWGNVVDKAYEMYPDAKFIMHTGDFVDSGSNFNQWNWALNATNTIKNTVIMPTAGNHETSGDKAVTKNFLISSKPNQDLTSGVYYSYDYNNAHFMVLNTNDLNADKALSEGQVNWLKEDCAKSDKQWKIVALHKAPYSNGSHYDDKDVIALRAQLSTLMNELNIDIVLEGNDHVYLRTNTMNDNKVVEPTLKTINKDGTIYSAKVKPDGTIYIIDGCAGVKYYQAKNEADTDKLFPRAEKIVNATTPVFGAIQIDGDSLYFNAYAVGENTTEKIDSFAILKAEQKAEETTTTEEKEPTSDETAKDEKIPTTAGQVTGKVIIAVIPLSAAALITAFAIKKKKEN
ncbi:MAG: metallophosphoesterase family protein, partial [Oscillospiraceae bacterium]